MKKADLLAGRFFLGTKPNIINPLLGLTMFLRTRYANVPPNLPLFLTILNPEMSKDLNISQ